MKAKLIFVLALLFVGLSAFDNPVAAQTTTINIHETDSRFSFTSGVIANWAGRSSVQIPLGNTFTITFPETVCLQYVAVVQYRNVGATYWRAIDVTTNDEPLVTLGNSGSTGWFTLAYQLWSTVGVRRVNTITFEQGAGSAGNELYVDQVIVETVPMSSCPAYVEADFTFTPETGDAPLYVQFTDTSTAEPNPIDTWLWEFRPGGDDTYTLLATTQNTDFTFLYPGVFDVRLTVITSDDLSDSVIKTITVTEGDPPPEPDPLVRPFREADENIPIDRLGGWSEGLAPIVPAYGLWDLYTIEPQAEAAVAFTQTRGAQVHAAIDGYVSRITRMDAYSCNSFSSNECITAFADYETSTGSISSTKYFGFAVHDVYIVTLQDAESSEYFNYLVKNPYEYISQNEQVGAGCILGEAVNVELYNNAWGSIVNEVSEIIFTAFSLFINLDRAEQWAISKVNPVDFSAGQSFTLIQRVGIEGGGAFYVPVVEHLTEYPEGEPRLCNYQPSSCISVDSEFKNPESWFLSNGNFEPSGGVVLQPGGRIQASRELALATTEYGVEIWARTLTGSGSAQVQLGLTVNTITIASTSFQQYLIAPAIHQPDQGIDYTLAISNVSTVPIYITSMCVSEQAGEGRPNVCYFADYALDSPTNAGYWTIGSGVYDGLSPGEFLMENGGSIGQHVTLYPDGSTPRQYTITITATVGFDIDALRADNTSTVQFNYEYPAGSGFTGQFLSPASTPSYIVSAFFSPNKNGITVLPGDEIVFTALVTASELMDSQFTIQSVITGDPDIRIRVREICINDPFEDWGSTGPPPPVLPTNCSAVNTPTSNDIGPWIFYHWSNLDRFFQCDLMAQLNKMFNLGYQAYTLAGWQARYWQSSAIMGANWLASNLLPWLNGHFSNIAQGSITYINAPESGCNNLFCFLEGFIGGESAIANVINMLTSIIGVGAGLFFNIISAIIGLVLLFATQLFNFMGQGQELIVAIIGAFHNAAPAPIPGMADCEADPGASALCMGLWVTEHTIFSGTGALIIPIFLGIMSVHVILWVIGEFRALVINIGKNS